MASVVPLRLAEAAVIEGNIGSNHIFDVVTATLALKMAQLY